MIERLTRLSMLLALVVGMTLQVTPKVAALNGFGTTRLALLDSHNKTPSDGNAALIGYSGNGRYLFFMSKDGSLVSGDVSDGVNSSADLFREDTESGLVSLVDIDGNGNQLDTVTGGVGSVAGTNRPSSADGRYVPFDYNGSCYVRDMLDGITTTLFQHSDVGHSCGGQAISADGRWVVYDLAGQVYLYDMTNGSTRLISRDAFGQPGNANSKGVLAFSADGNTLIYYSYATNLDPAHPDTYGTVLYDHLTDTNRVLTDLDGQRCSVSGVSADGMRYALTCEISYPDGVTRTGAAYYDVPTQAIVTIVNPVAMTTFSGISTEGISADGNLVAMQYGQDNPVNASDTDNLADGAFYDISTGTAYLTSISSDGTPANGTNSCPYGFTDDNSKYLFNAIATNLTSISTGFETNGYEHFIADNAPAPTYDFKAPTVSKLTVAPNPKPAAQTATVSVKATDQNGVARVEYFVGSDPGVGNAIEMAPGAHNFYAASIPNNLQAGTHVINVRAVDTSGNWSTLLSTNLVVQ